MSKRGGSRIGENTVGKVTWTAAMFLYSKFVCLSRKFMSVRERKEYNNKGFLDRLGERRGEERGGRGEGGREERPGRDRWRLCAGPQGGEDEGWRKRVDEQVLRSLEK